MNFPKPPSRPNQDALYKALFNIYRHAMCPFIFKNLETARDLLPEHRFQNPTAIDIGEFPMLFRRYWESTFGQYFDRHRDIRSAIGIITEARNKLSHRPEELTREYTLSRLLEIADILGHINAPEHKRKVEDIRENLQREVPAGPDKFLDNTVKAKYENDITVLNKRLATAKETNKKLSQRIIDNAVKLEEQKKEIEKLSGQLNSTSKQLEKLRSEHSACEENFRKISDQLASAESERADYKKQFEDTSKELQDVEMKRNASEERLVEKLSELAAAHAQKDNYRKQLAAMQGLFTTATLDKPEIRSIFPAFDTDSPVRILDRILDRRGTDKLDYLSKLLEQKQPAIIYVQSEEKVEQLLKSLPEKASVMKKHDENTSDAEEKEILGKLEKGELIAIVSSSTVSTLPESHCIDHFVFCHLVPDLNTFFERCRPIFTSRKSTYLHLIYESKQDIEGLAEKYPNQETLRKLYAKVIEHTPLGKDINPKVLYDELCKEKELDITDRGIETSLTIFKELEFLKENIERIKRPRSPQRKLEDSETYCRGKEQREAVESSAPFQYEQSIEQIWEEILRKVGIDSEKGMSAFNTLRQRAAKSTNDTDTFQHLKKSGAIEGERQGHHVRYGRTPQGETAETAPQIQKETRGMAATPWQDTQTPDQTRQQDETQAAAPSDAGDFGEDPQDTTPPRSAEAEALLKAVFGPKPAPDPETQTTEEVEEVGFGDPLLMEAPINTTLSAEAQNVVRMLERGETDVKTVEEVIATSTGEEQATFQAGLGAYINTFFLADHAGVVGGNLYFKSSVNTGPWRTLSNFFESILNIGGKNYKSVEHFFQSEKFVNSTLKYDLSGRPGTPKERVPLSEAIRRAVNPGTAFRYAQNHWNALSPEERDAWRERAEDVMRTALREKFSSPTHYIFDGQTMTLAEALILTGDYNLIHLEKGSPEHPPIWGAEYTAHGIRGENRLGELLMELRDELRKGQLVAPEQAIEITSPTDTTWRIHESELTYPLSEDEENAKDSQKKYDLAMQFAQEHGFSALEQGIAELMRDKDDPSYDFTEDETNMLGAFQDALKDLQAQSAQSTEMIKKDSEVSDEVGETTHTPKPPRVNAKVTVEQVKKIRVRSAAGESYSQLAKEFGLTPTSIRSIVLRNTWKHVE